MYLCKAQQHQQGVEACPQHRLPGVHVHVYRQTVMAALEHAKMFLQNFTEALMRHALPPSYSCGRQGFCT